MSLSRFVPKGAPPRKAVVLAVLALGATLPTSKAAVAASDGDMGMLLHRVAPQRLVLVGERHHRPESVELLGAVYGTMEAASNCVSVSLEIDHDQQDALDRLIHGSGQIEAVSVHPLIDHAAYRVMIVRLAESMRSAGCGRMIAADSGLTPDPTPRDTSIAQRTLAALQGAGSVVGLFGNRHVARGLKWTSKGFEDVASDQIETLAGVRPFVVIQHWLDRKKATQGGIYLDCANPIAAKLLVKENSYVSPAS